MCGQVFRSVARFHCLGIAQVCLDGVVEFAGSKHLFETMYRCGRMRCQIGVQVEFEILPDNQVPVRLVCQQLAQIGHRDLDRLRTLPFHLIDRPAHDRGHFAVFRISDKQGGQEPMRAPRKPVKYR